MTYPTVLTVYNRPWHTAQVLEALSQAKPEPLFIFSDGPKDDTDVAAVRAVRELIGEIGWTRPVVVARSRNLGLAQSVVEAVDYVLARHDALIALEDDDLPGPAFFPFMEMCLDRYRDIPEVMSVGGYTVPLHEDVLQHYPWDVYFFPRIETWGWATWRNAWQYYERDIEAAYERAIQAGIDLRQGGNDIPAMLKAKTSDQRDSWSPGWIVGVYLRGGCCVYPTVSHIRNIGFDGTGTNTSITERWETPVAACLSTRLPDRVVEDKTIYKTVKAFYG